MIRTINGRGVSCRKCGCYTKYASYINNELFWPLCGSCYQLTVYGYIDREPLMMERVRSGEIFNHEPPVLNHEPTDETPRRCNVERKDDATKSQFYPYVREY